MFTKVAALLFGLIALLHALRLLYGWNAVIGSLVVPLWASGVAVVVATLMAWGLWKEMR